MVQMNGDITRLRGFLDGQWCDVREEVRNQIRGSELLRPVAGLSTEEHRDRVWEQAKLVSGSRASRMFFPREVGGEGDMGGALTAFETLGLVDLSLLVKIGVQYGLFGGVIRRLGSQKHHQKYLRQAMMMELPGCFAMTETGHGSDVQSIRTTATYDPARQEFVINTPDDAARKDYIGNAARDGRMAAVFAQLMTNGEGHGVHVLLVPIRDERGRVCPGVRIEDDGHKGGLNGVDNGRIWFDNAHVPREALLDRFGAVAPDGTYSSPIKNESRRFFTMLGTLVSGRVSVAGAALGAAKLALTIAVRYGLERRQFKAPGREEEVILLDYLQHQRRLLPLVATSYAMHFAHEALVSKLHAAGDGDSANEVEQRQIETLAAGIKAVATWHAMQTIQTCREACGGAGYLSVNRLTELKADVDIFTTFEGDNTVLLQLVAKGLLTNFRDEFEIMDTVATVRFVADQVVGAVLERSPVGGVAQWIADVWPRSEEDASILDRRYHLRLLQWREKHVLEAVARRLRKMMSGGGDAFVAFNAVQDHLLLAARAHVDRVVLEHVIAAIDRCDEEEIKALLNKVCDLHVMALIERERGWLLEHGQLSAGRAKAVITNVNRLCGELRPHARLLVDAFGVPEELLPELVAATGDRSAGRGNLLQAR
ncbi:MAG: acyl-CoA oxidase [Chloroflexi bacterium]|nr:MAG: acyl-CoA oxidase [Chloroflexota bacterium]TME44553.1 MAG: acyl-CoA oxidase [Chloroflexota bacterium]